MNKELKKGLNADKVIKMLHQISKDTGYSFEFDNVDIWYEDKTFKISGISQDDE